MPSHPLPRLLIVALFLSCLLGCSENAALSGGQPEPAPFARHEQVQMDVQAIMQGMNNARAQAEAVARAKTKARVP